MRRATRGDVQVLRRPLPARQPVLRAAPRDVQGLGWRGSKSKAVHLVHAAVVPLRVCYLNLQNLVAARQDKTYDGRRKYVERGARRASSSRVHVVYCTSSPPLPPHIPSVLPPLPHLPRPPCPLILPFLIPAPVLLPSPQFPTASRTEMATR